jgi:hypothetical protein
VPPDQPIPVPDEAFVALEALREALAPLLRQGFGLGVGLKETAGEITDRIALVVYLPQKLPFDEVPDGAMIPTEFLGFQTDVVERDWHIAEDTTFHSPVVGGVQVGHTRFVPHPDGTVESVLSVGTLGAMVRRRQTGQVMGLTNCHVVKGNEFEPLDIMHQPGGGGRLGQARDNEIGGLVDCALIDLESRPRRFDVAAVGGVGGSDRMRFLWQPVKKRGYKTELTHGRTVRIAPGPHRLNTRERGWNQTYFLRDQIEVVAQPPDHRFIDSGDSGSVLLTVGVPELGIRDNMVIGLLCASHETVILQPPGDPITLYFALANQIQEVMRVLDVDIAVRPTVTAVTPNSALGSVATFGTVVIEGFGFDDSPQVVFGETQAIVITTGAERIEVVPPLHFPGVVQVRVSNRFGDQSEPGDAAKFTYEQLF